MEKLTPEEERKLFDMVSGIYHALNLDGRSVVTLKDRRAIEMDILRWKEKRAKESHERKAPV